MPWGWLEHLVEMSASCTPNIELSTKSLRCFHTATATEDVTSNNTIIITRIHFHSRKWNNHCKNTTTSYITWNGHKRTAVNCLPSMPDYCVHKEQTQLLYLSTNRNVIEWPMFFSGPSLPTLSVTGCVQSQIHSRDHLPANAPAPSCNLTHPVQPP